MTTRLLLVAILTLIAVNIISCKKKKNDNPFGNARIALIDYSHNGTIQHYRVIYDAYNNVDSLVYTGDGFSAGTNGFLAFNYLGSSYTVTDQNGLTFTVQANTSGLILKILRPNDTSSTIYNGTQLGEIDEKTPTLIYPYYHTTSTNYYWTNGDVSSSIVSGVTTSYDYDMSRNGQPGDPWRIGDFLNYGRSMVKTTHLLKDMTVNGNWVEKFNYQFDGSGRISQLTKVLNNGSSAPGDTTTYNYTYY